MTEIVVISGKGGTGKTSLTAAFAALAPAELVVADCDVDAADMHLLMQPVTVHSEPFFSGQEAFIDPLRCSNCGECEAVCRFDAILDGVDGMKIDPVACEGCGYCARVCPENAIVMSDAEVGTWQHSRTRMGSPMAHARLDIGADNSGKLVTQVRTEARKLAAEYKRDLILVDGPPGVGCPVVAALSGADYVVLVTEPTVSGIHDLRRVHELVRKFRIPCGCIINKYDLNPVKTDEIKTYLLEGGIDHLADLPYDTGFTTAMTLGRTIVETDQKHLVHTVENAWESIVHYSRSERETV